jgi:putative inorganic carbon (hco3(-)) transporter
MTKPGVPTDVTPPYLAIRETPGAWAATAALAVTVFATLTTSVTVTGGLVADDAGATPKAYHALLILGGLIILARGKIARPRAELLLYFGVTIASMLLTYLIYEPRVAGIKLLIALYAALVGTSLGRITNRRIVLRACRLAGVAFAIAVTIKNVTHVPAFIAYLARPFGHPDVPSLAGGGLNIEATWLALSSFFMIGTVLFVPVMLLAAATSALYASRVGVVIAVMAICAAVAHAWGMGRINAPSDRPPASRTHVYLRRIAALVLVGMSIDAVTVIVRAARQYGEATYVAQRFSAIGEDPGSLGRAVLWRGGVRVFEENPLGVGAGNAVPMLRRVLGVDVPEDNLHNIYLQHAVESGIPGLAALLVFAAMIARRVVKSRFRDQLLLFVAAYLVAGLIQFTGVDAMFWLAYGLQSGLASQGTYV